MPRTKSATMRLALHPTQLTPYSRPLTSATETIPLCSGWASRQQSREIDFSPRGGAYNRAPADATAFVPRDELFRLKHTAARAVDVSAEDREAAHRCKDSPSPQGRTACHDR